MTPGHDTDTIVAIATPAARAASASCGCRARWRRASPNASVAARCFHAARTTRFLDGDGNAIDDGIALLFVAPASYTGEEVVELQAHGSHAVLHALVARCVLARMARPGEFSERAFVNGQARPAQAEAVADLIAAADLRAAQAARRSLDGESLAPRRSGCRAVAGIARACRGDDRFRRRADRRRSAAAKWRSGCSMRSLRSTPCGRCRTRAQLRDGLHVVIVGPPNAARVPCSMRWPVPIARSSPTSPAPPATCCRKRCASAASRSPSSTPPDCAKAGMRSNARACAARRRNCSAPTSRSWWWTRAIRMPGDGRSRARCRRGRAGSGCTTRATCWPMASKRPPARRRRSSACRRAPARPVGAGAVAPRGHGRRRDRRRHVHRAPAACRCPAPGRRRTAAARGALADGALDLARGFAHQS